jgi:predicted kinase
MNSTQYIEHFKTTPEWAQMVATVENSPWHREESVAVHTAMCLQQYEANFGWLRPVRQNTLATIALLFHDVGKPEAEEVVTTNAERGVYRRYAGHEQVSAVAFTEQWLKDKNLQVLLTVDDARKVRWLIEHHLPYGLKDPNKLAALRAATIATLGDDEEVFYDVLWSDAAGRISDDHADKLQKVQNWISDFQKVEPMMVPMRKEGTGAVFLLVGPSGAGKSTWVSKVKRPCDRVFSLDACRLEYLSQLSGRPIEHTKEFYAKAWALASQDTGFFDAYVTKKLKSAFTEALAEDGDVFIDNTNTTRKARARWVQEARSRRMAVVGVEYWLPLAVAVERQRTRSDKSVPDAAVRSQHTSQTCTWLGAEVDKVHVVTNLENEE